MGCWLPSFLLVLVFEKFIMSNSYLSTFFSNNISPLLSFIYVLLKKKISSHFYSFFFIFEMSYSPCKHPVYPILSYYNLSIFTKYVCTFIASSYDISSVSPYIVSSIIYSPLLFASEDSFFTDFCNLRLTAPSILGKYSSSASGAPVCSIIGWNSLWLFKPFIDLNLLATFFWYN